MKRKKKFRFRSPGTGAYQVRLVGREVSNITAVLLNGANDVAVASLEPGPYTAIIEPVGSNQVTRQAVYLSNDTTQPVELQDQAFSTGVDRSHTERASYALAESSTAVQFKRPMSFGVGSSDYEDREGLAGSRKYARGEFRADQSRREFSLGLSVRHKKDSNHRWRRGTLPTTVSDEPGGGAAVVLRRPLRWETKPEWRLTAAVSEDRRWRMRVPLFRGGVQVVLQPAKTSSGVDLAVSLTPRRPERAALTANLESMFLGSARAIIQSSFPDAFETGRPFTYFLDEDHDPWTCTAAALLLVQADEVGDECDDLRIAAERCAFIPDMRVLMAWAYGRQGEERAALRALQAIPGHPYFAASQGLGIDLLTGLALGSSSSGLRKRASNERERWARVRRRQLLTGAFLSWEDSRPAATHILDRADYETIATGSVTSMNVELVVVRPSAPTGKQPVPAFGRDVVDPEDTWFGRFGGHAERDGFKLEATFSRGPAGWIEVTICVRITEARVAARQVELFLHETFHPDRLHVDFVDGVANHTVLAWGGFTVGAWIAERKVELELNLAKIDGAPAAIRDN